MSRFESWLCSRTKTPVTMPSSTAATVDSSSQLFLRKRFQSDPDLAGFPMAAGKSGRGDGARGSGVARGQGRRARECQAEGECRTTAQLLSLSPAAASGMRGPPAAQLALCFCVAAAPGSSCCRVLRRPGQPAREREERRAGRSGGADAAAADTCVPPTALGSCHPPGAWARDRGSCSPHPEGRSHRASCAGEATVPGRAAKAEALRAGEALRPGKQSLAALRRTQDSPASTTA